MVLGLSTGTLLVFLLVLVTVALFVSEAVPPDVTAIGVVVALIVLQPWVGLTLEQALSGFSNPATLTVVSMYVLSAGIGNTGLVRRLGVALADLTRGRESRLLVAVVAFTAPIAGVVNNTPVVAVLVPMVTDVANESGVSPSKLLIPLSYASMLGGTLTLVGTATNLVASDLSASLVGREFSMFTLTPVGAVVVLVGSVYLVTVGRRLLPERVPPGDRTAGYGMGEYLARVAVPSRSPLVGTPAQEVVSDVARDLDVDVLDVVRGDEHFIAADSDRHVRARDVLTVRGSPARIRRLVDLADLRVLPRAAVTDAELDSPERGALVELAVPSNSPLVGETIRGTRMRERYDATVLAVRRPGGELVRESLGDVELRPGDSLLVQTTDETVAYLSENGDFVVTGELLDDLLDRVRGQGLAPTTLPAVGILLAVVALAALDVVPVVAAALGGVVAMVVTGCVSANEAYDAVDWNVIFLLAGVLPLGIAVEVTGGATVFADAMVGSLAGFPPIVVLGAFYLLTGLFASVVTPVASVVLLLPVAVSTATRIGADPFAFVLAATFAASTAFTTPVGYQTNLMVYGPGGYRFTDYVRVGAPLQLLLAVVTTAGIALIWGVTPPA